DRVPGRVHVVRGKMELITAHPRQSAGGGANLGRKVWKRGDIIAIQRNCVGELAASDLHAVAGVPGEADHCLVDLFSPAFGQRRINKCGHKLPDPNLEKSSTIPPEERGSVLRMTRCKEQDGCCLRPPRAGTVR